MIQDLKEKRLSMIYLEIGAVLGILFFMGEIESRKLDIEIIFSFLPGIIFLLISKITKEKIGEGDGWLFLILGGCMGAKNTWLLWQISLILSSVFSLIVLVSKKNKAESQIAFVPFIWTAHVLLWSLHYGRY